MKLIYSELIEKVLYKKINCVVDFEYARKGVNEILSGLKFDDLKNLRLYTYQQRISKTKFKELSFSIFLPVILIIPGTLIGCLQKFFSNFSALLVTVIYLFFAGIVIVSYAICWMHVHTDRIESNLFLEKIIDDELEKRKMRRDSRCLD